MDADAALGVATARAAGHRAMKRKRNDMHGRGRLNTRLELAMAGMDAESRLRPTRDRPSAPAMTQCR
jgi:hypothetical protein